MYLDQVLFCEEDIRKNVDQFICVSHSEGQDFSLNDFSLLKLSHINQVHVIGYGLVAGNASSIAIVRSGHLPCLYCVGIMPFLSGHRVEYRCKLLVIA